MNTTNLFKGRCKTFDINVKLVNSKKLSTVEESRINTDPGRNKSTLVFNVLVKKYDK